MCRNHPGPRWYDERTGRILEFHDEFVSIFALMGAPSLLTMDHPAYKELTSEFLATIEAVNPTNHSGGYVSFRLGGEFHSFSFAEWNRLFDFNVVNGGSVPTIPEFCYFWLSITGMSALPNGSVSGNNIANPAIRIA